MRKQRLYADTSVFGGIADDEFAQVSRRFFDEVRAGAYVLLVSEVTARELRGAPLTVRQLVAGLSEDAMERIAFTPSMAELRDAYLAAKVVGARWADDAAHVAAATVARADLIVSWNFKHLVKWDKIRAYNSVNVAMGHPPIMIMSPREVVRDEDEEDV